MATTKQIKTFVNDLLKEVLGKSAPTIKNTTDLVNFAGSVNLSDNADLKDQLYTAIFDKVRKTYAYARKWEKAGRNIRRDADEWGVWYEEIRVAIGAAVDNASFVKENMSPYTVDDTLEVSTRYFKAWAAWEHDVVVYDRMLVSAFNSFGSFGSFVSALFVELDNTVEQEMRNNENLVIATAIAGVLKAGKTTQCRNLLHEYNTLTNASLTVDTCQTDKDFLTYAVGELQEAAKYISEERSTLYNTEGTIDFTPKEKLIVEVLNSFDKKIGLYLRKDTYHDNIVNLPLYSTVNYWQSGGESMAFDDTSKINISNDSYAKLSTNADKEALTLEQGGVIAVMRDTETCASVISRIKTTSMYNNRQERTVYYKKIEAGYGVNLGHNMVVFYIAEA